MEQAQYGDLKYSSMSAQLLFGEQAGVQEFPVNVTLTVEPHLKFLGVGTDLIILLKASAA